MKVASLARATALIVGSLLAASLAPAQSITVLRTFTNVAESYNPSSNLVLGADGLLYGVTADGGANANGTFYRIAPDGTGYTLLFSFPAGGTAPAAPNGHNGSWFQGRDGAFYGTTGRGGLGPIAGQGTLFKINADGSGFTVLRTFLGLANRDGGLPRGGLIQASDGSIYGTTFNGSGTSTAIGDTSGTIYKIAPDGSGYQIIFSFNIGPSGVYSNGREPTSLLQGRDGRLYGTTRFGGAVGSVAFSPGAIFTLRTDGTDFRLVRSFTGTGLAGEDGMRPDSPLVQDADGVLYGTTSMGGATIQGTIYRINPDGSGYRILRSFNGNTGTEGSQPFGTFFLAADGALYGTTSAGSTNSRGITYRINRDGSGFRILDIHPLTTGGFVFYGLTQTRDGSFFGSYASGVGNFGTLFRLGVPSGPVITQQPRSQVIAPGGSVTFTVVAPGATTYQWQRNGAAIPGATAASYTQANLTSAADGTYTVLASNADGTTVSTGAVLLVETPNPGRLINLSVRTSAGTGAQTLIAGFVVGGTGSKQVLVRAIGPTLGVFGVTGALADPQLGLFNASSTQIATNTVWGGGPTLTNAFAAVGAFALGATSRDAALLSPLTASGASGYSAQVVSASGGTGVALVEAYDADGATSTTRFINLSARTVAGTGAQTLIAGFVLSGNVPRTLLIRGVGPGLNQFGVTGTLANPRLELHTTINNVDTTVATNAGWAGAPALAAAFTQVGAFPLPTTSADAALLLTLAPGAYTAQVAGSAGATGVALVEVYEVP